MTEKPKSRRRRTPLDAGRIAAEALALVDEKGLEALSFRALGRRLGCEAMSLYHYYPSKAHLIDAMVSICLAETPVEPPGPPARERIRATCLAYRDTARRHPGFAPVLFTHRLNHREGLAWLDEITGLLPEAADERTRAIIFRVISYFLTGGALEEALGYAAGPSAAEPVPAEEAARDFPGITSFGAHFAPAVRPPFFEIGLEVLLDWMDDLVDEVD